MKICLYNQPSGDHLVVLKSGDKPAMAVFGRGMLREWAFPDTDIAKAILLLSEQQHYTVEGSFGNTMAGLLTKAFNAGVEFGLEKSAHVATSADKTSKVIPGKRVKRIPLPRKIICP